MRNAGENLKNQYSTSDLLWGWMQDATLVQVFSLLVIGRYCPNSSSDLASLGHLKVNCPEGVGRGMRAKIYKSAQHNRPAQGLEIVPLSRSFRFLSSGVTARIPLQSWKSLWAISMTARNQGVIAPGNH